MTNEHNQDNLAWEAGPQLRRLAIAFPEKYVESKQGAAYVNHAIVNQRMLGSIGPFSMRIDEIIRGDLDERETRAGGNLRTWPARTNAVVGVVLTCTFTIDGRTVEVSEVGEPEGVYMAAHDGERLKKAVSDAFKRCAMRVGLGLHLWSKGSYFLPQMLAEAPNSADAIPAEATAEAPDPSVREPDEVLNADEAEPEPEPEHEPEPEPPQSGPVLISADQEAGLRQIIRDSGYDPFEFAAYLQRTYGVNKLRALTTAQAEELMFAVQEDDFAAQLGGGDADEAFQAQVSRCSKVRDFVDLYGRMRNEHGEEHAYTHEAKRLMNEATAKAAAERQAARS